MNIIMKIHLPCAMQASSRHSSQLLCFFQRWKRLLNNESWELHEIMKAPELELWRKPFAMIHKSSSQIILVQQEKCQASLFPCTADLPTPCGPKSCFVTFPWSSTFQEPKHRTINLVLLLKLRAELPHTSFSTLLGGVRVSLPSPWPRGRAARGVGEDGLPGSGGSLRAWSH